MILIDTDHATHLKYPESERGGRLIDRLNAVSKSEVVGVAIVTVEERMRGWLATIAKEKTALRQVVGRLRLLDQHGAGLQSEVQQPAQRAAAVHQVPDL